MTDLLGRLGELRGTVRTAGRRAIVGEFVGEGLFRAKARERRSAMERFRGCRDLDELLALAQELFPGPFSQLPEEIVPFLHFATARSPRTVAEIGTQFGGTNFLLSQAIPTVTTMVGVDLLVQNRARLQTFRRPEQRIHLLNGSSQDDAMAARVASALSGHPLDLLFIDGDHRWDGVVSDFLRYRRFVRPGGLVVFHDIIPDDRLRGLPPTSAFAGEVPVLWSRLKDLYVSREFVRDPTQEGFGIGVLEYDPAVEVPGSIASL